MLADGDRWRNAQVEGFEFLGTGFFRGRSRRVGEMRGERVGGGWLSGEEFERVGLFGEFEASAAVFVFVGHL